jgi:hypothetical protein
MLLYTLIFSTTTLQKNEFQTYKLRIWEDHTIFVNLFFTWIFYIKLGEYVLGFHRSNKTNEIPPWVSVASSGRGVQDGNPRKNSRHFQLRVPDQVTHLHKRSKQPGEPSGVFRFYLSVGSSSFCLLADQVLFTRLDKQGNILLK